MGQVKYSKTHCVTFNLSFDCSFGTTGFAISSLETTLKFGETLNHQGTSFWQSLGLILSCNGLVLMVDPGQVSYFGISFCKHGGGQGYETCATSVTSVGFSAHVAGEAPGLKVEGFLNLIYGYFGGGVKPLT